MPIKLLVGPLLWLPLTIAVYYAMVALQRRAAGSPLVNPTLLTICAVCLGLAVSGVPSTQRTAKAWPSSNTYSEPPLLLFSLSRSIAICSGLTATS